MFGLSIILTIVSCRVTAKLDVVHEWKYIDYVWNSDEKEESAILEKAYNYTQTITIDVQKVQDGRIFVTTPVFIPPISPASLSTVSKKEGPGGPLLSPYPDWSWHSTGDCNLMTNVIRVIVDDCNRLWVLDNGKIEHTQVCPAQVLVFDLQTDKLQRKIQVPDDLSHSPRNKSIGFLASLVVETYGQYCEQTWVYIGDARGGGLIIWDGQNMWRLNKDVFYPDMSATNFTISGENIVVDDGIFGLALTPGKSSDSRRLFFRPLASLRQYSFSVNDLHGSATTPDNVNFNTSEYQFTSQVTAQIFSQDGTMFFGLTKETAIGCWNIHTIMNDEHVDIVAQDNEILQFASGLKVTKFPDTLLQEQLWVSTNRLQKLIAGTRNFNEINFRILSTSVDTLLENSKCFYKPDNQTFVVQKYAKFATCPYSDKLD